MNPLIVAIGAFLGGQEPLPVSEPPDELWAIYATAPGVDARRNVWHSAFNVPPFEEGRTVPPGILAARLWTDVSSGDFFEEDEGGRSIWRNIRSEELLQVDYGLFPHWQAGLRVSAGWTEDRQDLPTEVFDGGLLATKHLEREFSVGSVVLRSKYSNRWADYFDWAVLGEIKFPAAEARNVMTAQTVDMGMSLFGTRHLGKGVWIHTGIGFVAPLGETEFFVRNDNPNIFLTYSIGLTWEALPILSVFAQGEGNSSGLRVFKEIDHSVGTASGGARVYVGRGFSADVQAGGGFDEWSSEWFVSVGVNFATRLQP